ncbi:MAG: ATP-dependent zinc metalloprotease FtsH [Planctomycetota bacterium]
MSSDDDQQRKDQDTKRISRRLEKQKEGRPQWNRPFGWWPVILMLMMLWLWQDLASNLQYQTIPYSAFKSHLQRDELVACRIYENEIIGRIEPGRGQVATAPPRDAAGDTRTEVEHNNGPRPAELEPVREKMAERQRINREHPFAGTYEPPAEPFLFRTVPPPDDPALIKQLDEHNVDYTSVRPGFLSTLLFSWIIPIGLMIALWVFLMRRFGPGQGVMSFGRNKGKMVADPDTGVGFRDVAGCDEAKQDLTEVVGYLKDPTRFQRLGAATPKGVLLVGPPGTGKTLLARAVAGEAKVPFYSLSGSDFVEMFVGVGAARVRDLFEQAKRNAPCIVFIDELDAIGRTRSAGTQPGNDEREQTLNQLLVEMDGFEAHTNVILLAATNRPENLDQALLRPGRFDRQVLVDLPDLDGRLAILKVHARNKPLAADCQLEEIARATSGMAGADLSNVLNEAALLAARRDGDMITMPDLREAVERVVAGPERRSRRLNDEIRKRVAHHEVGHALVAALAEHADPVSKISIVPRGRAALGYTMQLPTEDQYLHTREELEDRIRVMLGGRAAEEEVYGNISTGAENDLDRASALARQMISMFGMSERNGLLHCQRRSNQFLEGMLQRECAETTATMIDDEARELLHRLYRDARETLHQHRQTLDRIAEALLEHETLEAERFQALLRQEQPPA